MAFELPTIADLKALYPQFAATGDAILTDALDGAASMVDESWPERDFKRARMLYAAHTLELAGHGSSQAASIAASMPLGFRAIRSGSLSFERGQSSASASSDPNRFGETRHGVAFLALLQRVKSGPADMSSAGHHHSYAATDWPL